MNDTDPKRAAALAFLKKNAVGALATISPEGNPSVRTLYYTADDNFCIYFLTFSNTRKAAHLLANPKAAFVVSDSDVPVTMQIEGTVSDNTENAAIDDTVRRLMETFQSRGEHFAPLNHFDPTTVTFFKLTPTWIRWGDFTSGGSTDKVLNEIRTTPGSDR